MYKKYISILIVLFILCKGFNLLILTVNDYRIFHNENKMILPISKINNSIDYKFGNNIISFDFNNLNNFNQHNQADIYLLGNSFNYSLEGGTKNYSIIKNKDNSYFFVFDKLIYQKNFYFFQKVKFIRFKILIDKNKKYQMYYLLLKNK